MASDERTKRLMVEMMSGPLPYQSLGDYSLPEEAQGMAVTPGTTEAERSRLIDSLAADHDPKEQAPAIVKIQKRGNPQSSMVPMAAVGTLDRLLDVVKSLYPDSRQPQLITFEGSIIYSHEEYERLLKPGVHIIAYFRPTAQELARDFDKLLGEGEQAAAALATDDTALEIFDHYGQGDGEKTIDFIFMPRTGSSIPLPTPSIPSKRYYLQPPKLLFYPPRDMRINVRLENLSVEGDSDTHYLPSQNPFIRSVSWDFEAIPKDIGAIAELMDVVSGEKRSSLSWSLGKEAPGSGIGSSEKRLYGNPSSEIRKEDHAARAAGWWMVALSKLPIGFTGPDGAHTFLARGVDQAVAFLRTLLGRCGIDDHETEEFINYWLPKLSPRRSSFRASTPTQDNPEGYGPQAPEDHLILIKLLHPEAHQALLPVSIEPPPDRMIRLFFVFRILTQEAYLREKIVPRGDLKKELDTVTGEMGICGGGPNCGHGGCLRVFELGGIAVRDEDQVPPRKHRMPDSLMVGEDGLSMLDDAMNIDEDEEDDDWPSGTGKSSVFLA